MKEERSFMVPCPVVAARFCFQKMFSETLMLELQFSKHVSLSEDNWRHQNYLLTYCMAPDTSKESDSLLANQEFPHTLWISNFHQHIHKFPPPVPTKIHSLLLKSFPECPFQYHSLIYAPASQRLFPSFSPPVKYIHFSPPICWLHDSPNSYSWFLHPKNI